MRNGRNGNEAITGITHDHNSFCYGMQLVQALIILETFAR